MTQDEPKDGEKIEAQREPGEAQREPAKPGELTGKQRRYLRGLGHHLSAVVHIGHEGVSDAVVAQTATQLEAHELIKVKLGEGGDRHEAAEQLAERTHAHLAQVLGRTFLLYKRRKKDPEIKLP